MWCGDHFHELLIKNLGQRGEEKAREDGSLSTPAKEDKPDVDADEATIPVPEIFDQTFTEADSYLNAAHGIFSGCTAVVALHRRERRQGANVRVLYTANVGDSRAVLLRGDTAIRLSYDHKGSDVLEQQRVKDSGGFIFNDRVNGLLAITRALGDSEMKDYIAGRPYTTETVLKEGEDRLLILACDGLWDVCSDQEACQLIRDVEDPQAAAQMLVEYALKNGSFDNLSVLVVRFRHSSPSPPAAAATQSSS